MAQACCARTSAYPLGMRFLFLRVSNIKKADKQKKERSLVFDVLLSFSCTLTPDDLRGSFHAGRVCLLVALGVFRIGTHGKDIEKGRRMVLGIHNMYTLEYLLALTKL